VPELDPPRFRPALATDAAAIAALHANSWRRHYRGAYDDSYLDGDVGADRAAVWHGRFQSASNHAHTHVAEHEGVVVGFVHTILDADPAWGALLDNLHIAHGHQRRGTGARLLRLSARTVVENRPGSALHLWVLEQNQAAQAFYRSMGSTCVERDEVPAPGGMPGRLTGTPACLRLVWRDPRHLLRT
jgi:ribosomal protein S18 acetylase RimI-like enzyme